MYAVLAPDIIVVCVVMCFRWFCVRCRDIAIIMMIIAFLVRCVSPEFWHAQRDGSKLAEPLAQNLVADKYRFVDFVPRVPGPELFGQCPDTGHASRVYS